MIVKVRSHTVYKMKDGRYKCEVWYIDETGETRRTTHTHPSQSSINKFLKDYPDGEYYPVCTLNEFFKNIFLDVLEKTVKNTSYVKFVSLFNSQIKPVIGDKKMKGIKKSVLVGVLDDIAGAMSDSVVKDCHKLLKMIFECYAEPKGKRYNYMRFVNCPESRVEKKAKKGYSSKDLERIFAVADSVNPDTCRPKYMHGNAVKFMLLTDMKIGEALALTWADVDFKNSTITVNKTSSEINLSEDGKTDYSIKFKPLSKNRTRVITITSEMKSVLLFLRKQNPNSKFVISQRNGDPVSKSYISRVMRECIKEACGG